MVGSFAMQQSVLDIWIMLIAGIIAFFLGKYGFPVSPLALGLILGPVMEQSFGLSMIMFLGDVFQFFTRPLALIFFALAIFSLVWPFVSSYLFKEKK